MRFKDKVALVTGGNGGIGAGIVKALLKEGAKVAFCDLNPEKIAQSAKEFKGLSEDVLAMLCDLGSSKEVKDMFAQIIERFGTLDILVNNAGVPRRVPADRDKYLELTTNSDLKFSLGITRNMSDEEWEDSIRNNLNSVFYCCREALNIMEPKGYGKIVNVASMAGVSNRSPHSPNYSAGKGGVVAFTRSLAAEVAGAGVYVNAVAPGFVATNYMSSFAKKNVEVAGKLVQGIPLKRMSTVDEQVAVITFLASDESNYILGQCINVNGGMF
ncbi:MAG: SDR family NAD(P)-dependent oxidoreductase [Dehalobacterium sp.]